MKKFVCFFFICLCAVSIHAQGNGRRFSEQREAGAKADQYKQIVSQILNDDELFVLFYEELALVVDPRQESPIVVRVGYFSPIANPWNELTDYIVGKSNIYFCPSGAQLSSAIEYLPCPIDKSITMSDQYAMYRLSSPEELFENRSGQFKDREHKAVIFGGLRYDEQTTAKNDSVLAFRGVRKAIGYGYLKSTYDEAIYIDSIFRKNKIPTALITGKNGTEGSFARIPDNHIDILHIASHGFYEPNWDNPEASSLQEWMMSHSGLILAGADRGSDNRSDDGMLTAYEISQTDLSGVNLVVLSACNTGLGDVKENDVYGLLKGFKKAGAGTVMVSLSEVNDTVTYLLMKRFYDNLFRGDNPRRALENAQRYIRLLGNGKFNKPEYWATFILVDDLDRNIGKNVSQKTKNAFLSDIVGIQEAFSVHDVSLNWDLIKKSLKPEDIVLKIFPYFSGTEERYQDEKIKWHETKYVVLIGDPETDKCFVRRLENTDQPKALKLRYYFFHESLLEEVDSLFWRQIFPFIEHKQRIFLQASGLYSHLPVEYTPMVFDDFDIYRLSSLDVLNEPTGSKHPAVKNIALFGGLHYDRGLKHYGCIYLPSTKRETDTIAEMFKDYHVDLFQGKRGTENQFRSLSGKPIQIIHLAMCCTATSLVIDKIDSVCPNKPLPIYEYLPGSILLVFSAESDSSLDTAMCDCDHDGFLTGADISKLKFGDVQLLTLGNDVDGEMFQERVGQSWGVVRAFKKAGVKSIMAPISSCNDGSTSFLMTEFYKNWLSGMSKLEALKAAQRAVRSHTEKRWNEPRYWAIYILFDAIE